MNRNLPATRENADIARTYLQVVKVALWQKDLGMKTLDGEEIDLESGQMLRLVPLQMRPAARVLYLRLLVETTEEPYKRAWQLQNLGRW